VATGSAHYRKSFHLCGCREEEINHEEHEEHEEKKRDREDVEQI
jgi:hypothetical protein